MVAIVLIFKISDAKSREFRSQNYAISAPKVRARRKSCSQTQSNGIRCRVMHSCAFIEAFGKRWARGARQNRAEDHRIIRDFNRKSRFLNAKFCGKKVSLSSGQAAHLVHRASNDRRCHPCAFVREFMAAMGQITADFENIGRKIARISITKLRDFGAEGACKT